MCLLMCSMPGEMPNYEYLQNAASNNPDGFGYAVHHGDRIVTGRGMNSQITIDKFFDELDRSNGEGIGVFHARITTHGDSIVENCHPFRVGGDKDIVLAHNGMLPIHPKAGDRRSDTRIFAEDVLPSLGIQSLDDDHSFAKLEEWASGSKLVILANTPLLKHEIYIVNELDGHWDGGIWWSNSSYKSRYSFYSGGYYSNKSYSFSKSSDLLERDAELLTTEYTDYTCYVCQAVATEEEMLTGVCSTCNSCLECCEHAYVCMCYTPTSALERRDNDLVLW